VLILKKQLVFFIVLLNFLKFSERINFLSRS